MAENCTANLATDAAIEHWLREDVASVYDAAQADPARSIPADKVFRALRDHHAERLKAMRRA